VTVFLTATSPFRAKADLIGEPVGLLFEFIARFLFRIMSTLFGPEGQDGYGLSDWILLIALLTGVAIGIAWAAMTLIRVTHKKGKERR